MPRADKRSDVRDHVRRGCFFPQLICPTGRFSNSLSSPLRENISLFQKPKSVVVFAVPPRQEGRTRRHERGVGCGGRGGVARRAALDADGEVVWSWRPDAGAKLSRIRFAKVTGARTPGPRGERDISR
jgi:hypothetical protein